jgi:hypothetical protein
LFPYHFTDVIVQELKILPFNYYFDMMAELMKAERSYDTLPNYTAIDIWHLMKIGR